MSTQVETSITNVTIVGARAAAVKNLKILKTLEEGGTKKEYEEFLERILSYVMVQWNLEVDIGYIMKKKIILTYQNQLI